MSDLLGKWVRRGTDEVAMVREMDRDGYLIGWIDTKRKKTAVIPFSGGRVIHNTYPLATGLRIRPSRLRRDFVKVEDGE